MSLKSIIEGLGSTTPCEISERNDGRLREGVLELGTGQSRLAQELSAFKNLTSNKSEIPIKTKLKVKSNWK